MSKIILMLNKHEDIKDISSILQAEKHRVVIAEKGISVRGYMNDNPDLVIIDAAYGNAMVEETRKNLPSKPVICLLPDYNARQAVELLRSGAFDCIYPPFRRTGVNVVVNHAIRSFGLYKDDPSRNKKAGSLINRKNIAGFITAVAFVFFAAFLATRKDSSRIELPYNDPTSIVYDAGGAWISNWYTQSIYRYAEKKSGFELKKSYYFSDFGPLALTKNENYLWSVGNDLVLRQHILNENLDVIRSYRIKENSPTGMAFIGNNLWLCDASTKKIYQYYVGAEILLVNAYSSGLSLPVGLHWDGRFIWIADAAANKVYLFSQKMDNLELAKIYRLPKHGTGTLSGLSVQGGRVFLIYTDNPSFVIVIKKSALKPEI